MTVAAQIEEFIREIAPDVGPIDPGIDLVEEEVIDSLGIVQLLSLIEERYGITISDDELDPDNFRSVDRIAAFVESKAQAA